jgi:hypothetical protein
MVKHFMYNRCHYKESRSGIQIDTERTSEEPPHGAAQPLVFYQVHCGRNYLGKVRITADVGASTDTICMVEE